MEIVSKVSLVDGKDGKDTGTEWGSGFGWRGLGVPAS